ncbi:hypothetical protein EM308_08315 [Flavobacterium gilvum]|uniref:Uncharacterized protein n=1 Tax=Flavobacterium gilvum TaxID=1492737 RepID=A0AAC9I4Z2_9FLAO|nr:hypothetical protein EM308_08315 [Flavobacterium gilvum]
MEPKNNTSKSPRHVPKSITYEIQISMFSVVEQFIRDSLRYLEYECGLNPRDIRISIPKRVSEAMHYYYKEKYSISWQNHFPTKYQNVDIIQNYKNEIAVYCIYFEKHENELIRILNLQQ